MPYYYLISEVPDSTEEPIFDIRTYKKPETYNLLLPSIHASREDNILDTGSDTDEAVRNLQNSCRDSRSWPSTKYCDTTENSINNVSDGKVPIRFESTQYNDNDPISIPLLENDPKPPVMTKYRPPSWAYDSIRPDLLEAARNLFYDRKRQQAMYAGVPSWSYMSGAPRLPTDYELFAAWAGLPRSDKLAYIAEVSNSNSSSLVPSDSLSTQRAVTSLLAACSDSCSWPSFQFSRLQAQQRPPLFHPHLHPHHYQHH